MSGAMGICLKWDFHLVTEPAFIQKGRSIPIKGPHLQAMVDTFRVLSPLYEQGKMIKKTELYPSHLLVV